MHGATGTYAQVAPAQASTCSADARDPAFIGRFIFFSCSMVLMGWAWAERILAHPHCQFCTTLSLAAMQAWLEASHAGLPMQVLLESSQQVMHRP